MTPAANAAFLAIKAAIGGRLKPLTDIERSDVLEALELDVTEQLNDLDDAAMDVDDDAFMDPEDRKLSAAPLNEDD